MIQPWLYLFDIFLIIVVNLSDKVGDYTQEKGEN